ncbi:MAG: DUF2788 domain-containing protein [Azoarcus sp.]|jgi:hypothetical protein|nr:DUF2788 domain-containing protein [Azoarcus sp.]
MDDVVAFGFTVDQISWFGVNFCIPALILYMLFIIYSHVKESKAGKYGGMWMFLALGLGFVGFVAKEIMLYFMEK